MPKSPWTVAHRCIARNETVSCGIAMTGPPIYSPVGEAGCASGVGMSCGRPSTIPATMLQTPDAAMTGQGPVCATGTCSCHDRAILRDQRHAKKLRRKDESDTRIRSS